MNSIIYFERFIGDGFLERPPKFGWLVVWTPLKNISQLGWLFPIYGKIKNGNQTTNQLEIFLAPESPLGLDGAPSSAGSCAFWLHLGMAVWWPDFQLFINFSAWRSPETLPFMTERLNDWCHMMSPKATLGYHLNWPSVKWLLLSGPASPLFRQFVGDYRPCRTAPSWEKLLEPRAMETNHC